MSKVTIDVSEQQLEAVMKLAEADFESVSGGATGVEEAFTIAIFAEVMKELSGMIIRGMDAPGYNSAAGPGALGEQQLGNLNVTAP